MRALGSEGSPSARVRILSTVRVLTSASLTPSDSRIAALFRLSASTCICMASCTRGGSRMSPGEIQQHLLD
ncbi:hypothetical protein E2C01_000801 [Portunus trituberculatus]|uniref:Uncharacterized protein n=1 Tax=Portunus trituberculatus TaxID=210409 RepID=A0A5B7CKX4_PORTR|nr:hypothetical protein [Portunus trituberculatus]